MTMTMTITDKINLAIAGGTALSAFIALITVIVSTRQSKKINQSVLDQNKNINSSTLVAPYYTAVFQDFLINDIPECRRKIRFDNGKIQDIEDLHRTLDKMICDSSFFKYQNNEFYNDLKNKIRSLQRYITEIKNRDTFIDDSDESKIKEKINEDLSLIYSTIICSLTNESKTASPK